MESSINAPHPDDTGTDEADLFFGGSEPEAPADPAPETFDRDAEAMRAEAEAYRERTGEPEPIAGNVQSAERTAELAAERDAKAAAAAPDPTPTDDGGQTGSTTEPVEAEPAPAAAPVEEQVEQGEQAEQAGNGKQSGPLSREYIVFHKLPLTKRVLEHLLKELEERGGEPRQVFAEIHRTEARNARGAVSGAYAKHHERLGEKCDLAAVSTKAFQEKHIEPEEVPAERRLKIT